MDRSKIQIAFTEDQAGFQRKFLRAMQSIGFSATQITMTFTAADAIDEYNENKPQVMVLDINLSDSGSHLDGFELLEELKVINGGVIFGILSGSAEKSEIEKARKLGAIFYIKKVGTTDKFKARLNEWVDDFFVPNPPTEMKVYVD